MDLSAFFVQPPNLFLHCAPKYLTPAQIQRNVKVFERQRLILLTATSYEFELSQCDTK